MMPVIVAAKALVKREHENSAQPKMLVWKMRDMRMWNNDACRKLTEVIDTFTVDKISSRIFVTWECRSTDTSDPGHFGPKTLQT